MLIVVLEIPKSYHYLAFDESRLDLIDSKLGNYTVTTLKKAFQK